MVSGLAASGLWSGQDLQLLAINLTPFYWFDRKGLIVYPVSRPAPTCSECPFLVGKRCPVLWLVSPSLVPQKGVLTVISETAQQCKPQSCRWRNLGDLPPKSTSTPKQGTLTARSNSIACVNKVGWTYLPSHIDIKVIFKLLVQTAPQLLGRCYWTGQFIHTLHLFICLIYCLWWP